MTPKRTLWIVLAVGVLLLVALVAFLVTRSNAGPGESAASTTPAPTASSPEPEPEALPDDTLVAVEALAHDTSGAELQLRLIVHKPAPRDDPASSSDLALLAAGCSADPNWATLADPEAGVGRIDVTSISTGPVDWPATSELPIMPLSGNMKVSTGEGIGFSTSYQGDPVLPECEQVRSIYGEADGALVVYYFPREFLGAPVSTPNTFRWINQEYGFFASLGSSGPVTLSDCHIEVTDAAVDFGWSAELWHELNDDYSCAGSGVFF
jgi:hypothetical protein